MITDTLDSVCRRLEIIDQLLLVHVRHCAGCHNRPVPQNRYSIGNFKDSFNRCENWIRIMWRTRLGSFAHIGLLGEKKMVDKSVRAA